MGNTTSQTTTATPTPPRPLDIEKLTAHLESLKSTDDWESITHDEKRSPVPYSKSVSIDSTASWTAKLLADPKQRLAMSAFTNAAAKDILVQRSAVISDQHKFNVSIPGPGAPITNQRSSGRCWLFATTNVLRVAVMKRYNIKELELSQAYLFFWDKLEKANYFLETILDTVGEDLEGRLLQTMLHDPISDGGQWDMAVNLVNKYGIVPQAFYPDSFNAMNSATMDKLLCVKLRENALILRKAINEGKGDKIGELKDKMMREIHTILVLMLGPPPSPTDTLKWEYYNNSDKFVSVDITPLSLARELSSKSTLTATNGYDVNRLFSLIHDPRSKLNTLLTVDKLGNVYNGRPITYVNVSMQTVKDAAIKQLKAGIPVFFGSDVGQASTRDSGIMDTDVIDYTLGFNIKLGMSKASRLLTGESQMTHAMVLTAVHLDESGKSVRWRVENSWGKDIGDKGYMVMTDKWMDEYVFQVVVDPMFVSKETRDILKQDALVLPRWDPLGALA